MASSSGLRSRITEITTCPICRDDFKAPRLLPCAHSFCLQCLLDYCKDKCPGDDALCPVCRDEFKIPRSGVKALPVNCDLQNLIEARDLESKNTLSGCPKEINLLVIGETGTGKSTWINAVANYLKFGSLEEAEQAGGEFPIHCHFEVYDPQTGELITISSKGDDEAADAKDDPEVGESVTKMPNEYVYSDDYIKLTVIDTPGLRDTGNKSEKTSCDSVDTPGLRDTGNKSEKKSCDSVDKEHVNNILRLLSSYKEIHAICILLKSSENRLSDTLKYTLTEIMTHFDTDAANNIIFLFTYASATQFKPGNIQRILQRFLKDNKLNIPVRSQPPYATIYCFENDTVSYLAQCKNKIPQTTDDKEDAQRHWKRSQKSTTDLFAYVFSLSPHSLANINAIYNAEHTISVLSEFVLAMSMCNLENVAELERKKKAAIAVKENIDKNPDAFAKEDVHKLLVRTKQNVVVTSLDYKNVVCQSSECSKVAVDETVDPPRLTEYYPQICCENCWSPLMYFCLSMTWGKECTCKRCGCGKSMHKSTTTEQHVATSFDYMDVSVIDRMVDHISAKREMAGIAAEYQRLTATCNDETEQMLNTCAKLSSFVQHSVLVKSSNTDKMSERLEEKIKMYEREAGSELVKPTKMHHHDEKLRHEKIAQAIAAKLRDLQKIQHQYNVAKQKCRGKQFSLSDVSTLTHQLYNLKLNGKELQKAMEAEEIEKHTVVAKGRQANSLISVQNVQEAASKFRAFFRNISQRP